VTPLINAVSVVMLLASMILIALSLGLQRGRSGRAADEVVEPASMFDRVT
jgi:hypothetical protein